ncbi:cupin domain-containing protein [Paraburkholderia sp. 22099]|uniref:cupin domain-containing protein n=1 Tax=Paraburkholderia sp. 22099 TaxID=3453875 RepID=UPI002683B974
MTHNGGGEFLSVGGYFTLADGQADLLLNVLPPVIHVREELGPSTLRWRIEHMREELREAQPGSGIVAQQLATLVLVQALRLQLAGARNEAVGWLFALTDKRKRTAINAMHETPGAKWTLQALAEHVAHEFRHPVQGIRRALADGLSDALAYDLGHCQADALARLGR